MLDRQFHGKMILQWDSESKEYSNETFAFLKSFWVANEFHYLSIAAFFRNCGFAEDHVSGGTIHIYVWAIIDAQYFQSVIFNHSCKKTQKSSHTYVNCMNWEALAFSDDPQFIK